jgi:ABC-type polar amino acid transport system ATPase subunit
MNGIEGRDIYAGYGKIEVLPRSLDTGRAGRDRLHYWSERFRKSTLLKSLFVLIMPRKGAVLFDGRKMTHLTPEEKVRSGIAFVPQGGTTFASLTVRRIWRLEGHPRDNEREVRRAIDEVLEAYPS